MQNFFFRVIEELEGAAVMADSSSGKEEMEEKHKALVTDMFQKITDYLNGELAGKVCKVCYSPASSQMPPSPHY